MNCLLRVATDSYPPPPPSAWIRHWPPVGGCSLYTEARPAECKLYNVSTVRVSAVVSVDVRLYI